MPGWLRLSMGPMFETLSDKLSRAMKSLRGQSRLTERNIEDALREVRMALLEADVHVSVARTFLQRVKEKALGAEVPIVLITAFAEHAVEAFDADAADYLLKPVTASRLERALKREGPCLVRVPVAAEDNVYPIVPPGAANVDMIGGESVDQNGGAACAATGAGKGGN